MELVGFNARQVEEGLTKRGDAQRKTKPKQGPPRAQCLADTISKLSREQMEILFNQMVQRVVALGFLDGERIAALDESLFVGGRRHGTDFFSRVDCTW
jgi:hypothetical protein